MTRRGEVKYWSSSDRRWPGRGTRHGLSSTQSESSRTLLGKSPFSRRWQPRASSSLVLFVTSEARYGDHRERPENEPCDRRIIDGRFRKADQFFEAAETIREFAGAEAEIGDAYVTLCVTQGSPPLTSSAALHSGSTLASKTISGRRSARDCQARRERAWPGAERTHRNEASGGLQRRTCQRRPTETGAQECGTTSRRRQRPPRRPVDTRQR